MRAQQALGRMVPELARERAIPVTQLRSGRYAPKGGRANPDALRGDGSAAESGVTWLGPTTRAFALCPAVDMRKGFDGLYGLATQTLGRDVLRGDLFLFVGRDCLRAKPLYFDGTGLCLLHKRLSKGRFAAPCRDAQRTERSFTFSNKAVGPPPAAGMASTQHAGSRSLRISVNVLGIPTSPL